MMDQVRLGNSSQAAHNRFRIMHCDYHYEKTINVLLVGQKGVGKTTIINTLINENAFVLSTTGYSETREPSWQTCVFCKENSNVGYQLNILDTPGLQECNKDAIYNCFAQWMKESVTSLNVICFVTVAGNTYEQDMKIFKTLKAFLGQNYSLNAMIILTHCEQIPDTRFEQYKKDLREHPYTKEVYEYCQLGVFSYGVVNIDNLVDLEKDVQGKVTEVRQRRTEQMCDKLLETFIGCADKPVLFVQVESREHNANLQGRAKKEKQRQNRESPRKKSCSICCCFC